MGRGFSHAGVACALQFREGDAGKGHVRAIRKETVDGWLALRRDALGLGEIDGVRAGLVSRDGKVKIAGPHLKNRWVDDFSGLSSKKLKVLCGERKRVTEGVYAPESRVSAIRRDAGGREPSVHKCASPQERKARQHIRAGADGEGFVTESFWILFNQKGVRFYGGGGEDRPDMTEVAMGRSEDFEPCLGRFAEIRRHAIFVFGAEVEGRLIADQGLKIELDRKPEEQGKVGFDLRVRLRVPRGGRSKNAYTRVRPVPGIKRFSDEIAIRGVQTRLGLSRHAQRVCPEHAVVPVHFLRGQRRTLNQFPSDVVEAPGSATHFDVADDG